MLLRLKNIRYKQYVWILVRKHEGRQRKTLWRPYVKIQLGIRSESMRS